MLQTSPEQTLRNAAYRLMKEKSIWYDSVPNERGDMVPGPHRQAVNILCRLAGDIQKERSEQSWRS